MSVKNAAYYKSRYEAAQQIIDRLSSDKAELVMALEEIGEISKSWGACCQHTKVGLIVETTLSKMRGEKTGGK